jgi:XTP/dITP diphosphohydrolase
MGAPDEPTTPATSAPSPGAVMTVVLATKNRGKLAELRALLDGLPIDVRAIDDVAPSLPPVVEDGATFEDNALLKARAAADATRLVSLADDSGLEVEALGGRPGVRSARFAGEAATDAENNAALLSALAEVEGDEARRARFRCVVVIVDPLADGGGHVVAEGRCDGTIAREPRGTGGFGYDPLFVVDGLGKALAELDDAEKNRISHRGQAAAVARRHLEELVAARVAHARRVLGEAGAS